MRLRKEKRITSSEGEREAEREREGKGGDDDDDDEGKHACHDGHAVNDRIACIGDTGEGFGMQEGGCLQGDGKEGWTWWSRAGGHGCAGRECGERQGSADRCVRAFTPTASKRNAIVQYVR